MEPGKKAKSAPLRRKAALGGKRKLPGKSALSRMQILDAAAQLFRRQGYSETTLRQIAKAAGMQAGSIYYHFASKDEIVDEVLATGMREIYKLVEKTVAAGGEESTYRERIERGMIAHLDLLLTKGDYFSSNIRLYGQIPEALRPDICICAKNMGSFGTSFCAKLGRPVRFVRMSKSSRYACLFSAR